jgi:DNA-binding Lrp family transcriptional regulator
MQLDDFIYNTNFGVNEIARMLKRSPSSVSRRAKKLGVTRFSKSFYMTGRPRGTSQEPVKSTFNYLAWMQAGFPTGERQNEGLSSYITGRER